MDGKDFWHFYVIFSNVFRNGRVVKAKKVRLIQFRCRRASAAPQIALSILKMIARDAKGSARFIRGILSNWEKDKFELKKEFFSIDQVKNVDPKKASRCFKSIIV